MITLRPTLDEFKLVFYWVGRVISGVGLLMLLPMATALFCGEWDAALDFTVGALSCVAFWLLTESTCRTRRELGWMHGMVVVSLGWLTAMVFGAIPSYLSGHYASFLDACFDLMSGYTTTGLVLIQDLDHVSLGLNMWRHLLTYAGGQGIIVIALTFLFSGGAGAFRVYVGEGRDERLLPNVIRTARAIWMISLTYMALGSFSLWLVLSWEGMSPGRGLFHSVWLFMGAWSTGGFAPQSLNLMYYQSLAVELVTMVIFVVGSLNFALHYEVWTGRKREVFRNIEFRSMGVTLLIGTLLLTLGLSKAGVLQGFSAFFRRGFYSLISGHTTTGNSNIYSVSFTRDFGNLALWAMIMVMMVGASACSTGGGLKGLRMGITFKSLWLEIKKIITPEYSVVSTKVHHIKDIWLDDALVKGVMLVVICYMTTYMGGAVLGMLYRYDPSMAFFESVSAGSNTGLSCGLTAPAMPALMKAVYIIMMWAGRLEFISVFALFGMTMAIFHGRKGRKGIKG